MFDTFTWSSRFIIMLFFLLLKWQHSSFLLFHGSVSLSLSLCLFLSLTHQSIVCSHDFRIKLISILSNFHSTSNIAMTFILSIELVPLSSSVFLCFSLSLSLFFCSTWGRSLTTGRAGRAGNLHSFCARFRFARTFN